MSEYWSISAGGNEILSGRNYLPDEIMTIFRENDRRYRADLALELEHREGWGDRPKRFDDILTYRITAKTLRSRLRLLGFDSDRLRAQAIDYFRAEVCEDDEAFESGDEDQIADYSIAQRWRDLGRPDPARLYDDVVSWVKTATDGFPPRMSVHDGTERFYADLFESMTEAYDDPRFRIALLTAELGPNAVVRLRLTNLLLGGWLELDERPALTARERLDIHAASGGRVIVVTEGSTDARLIRRAIEITYPDLSDFYSFLDFAGTSAPGGTDRVVSLTRGLAAAGVLNRVVAVFDNDTAGRQAEQQLRSSHLPSTFSVMRLPDVAFARRYPTLGPTGSATQDVNGRACSIELMFGPKALTADDGSLFPVRWSTYLPRMGDYQGEIEFKARVQEAIEAAMTSRTPDPSVRRHAGFLADTLLSATPYVQGPLSGPYSPLLASRVHEGAAD